MGILVNRDALFAYS